MPASCNDQLKQAKNCADNPRIILALARRKNIRMHLVELQATTEENLIMRILTGSNSSDIDSKKRSLTSFLYI
jgi:hypothetical protein